MPDPKKGVAYTFEIGLIDQLNRPNFKTSPTLASGDFKVSIDGSALNNLATLPTVAPVGSRIVEVALSNTEMNGDRILIQAVDAAGSEWDDVLIYIDTNTRNVDDLAYPATSGRSLAVDTSGRVTAGSLANDVITDAAVNRPRGSVVADGGNTALTFKTNLASSINDFYKDMILKFTSGTMSGELKKVAAYDGTTNFITVQGGFTAAPSAADNFDLING